MPTHPSEPAGSGTSNIPSAPNDPTPLFDAAPDTGIDTNLDDVVEVAEDQQSFGNDTGLMGFDVVREDDQVVLPLFTYDRGPLPVHAYLASKQGSATLEYSLSEHIADTMVVRVGSAGMKRVSIMRPRGDVVNFDFPKDANGHFLEAGYPVGSNAGRLYVLHDLTPLSDTDGEYELQFPSGIVHRFLSGLLTSVSDVSGSSVSIGSVSGNNGFVLNSTVLLGKVAAGPGQHAATSPQYDIDVTWDDGKLQELIYHTTIGGRAIRTEVQYGADGIASLDKYDDADNFISEFSYAYENGDKITINGIEIQRCADYANGVVDITTTMPGGKYREVETHLNSNNLITSQTVSLSGSPNPATTTYIYAPGTSRYPANGAPVWGKIEQITYSDGSWEKFEYAPDTGWLLKHITPVQDTQSEDGEWMQRVETFSYDNADGGGGSPAQVRLLTERLRSVVTTVKGIETGRTFYRFTDAVGAVAGPSEIRQARQPGVDFVGPTGTGTELTGNLRTIVTPHAMGPANVQSPTGTVTYAMVPDPANGGPGWRQLIVTEKSPGGTILQTQTLILDGFGNIVTSETKALTHVEAAGTEYGQNLLKVVAQSQATVDPFGRIKTTFDWTNGQKTSYSYDDGSGHESWLGPLSFTDVDGVTTDYLVYTAAGQVKQVTALGVTSDYEYDAAGNVIHTTRTGTAGGVTTTVSTSARYDALGRPESLTDEVGNPTTFTYTTEADGYTVKTTYADSSTYVQTYYVDGSPKKTSGTSTYPVEYSSGIDARFHAGAGPSDPDTGGYWTQTSSGTNKSNVQRQYYNALGRVYRSTQSLDDAEPPTTAESRMTFDAMGRAATSTGFDGVTTILGYDAFGSVGSVTVDVNKDGTFAPSSGDQRALYSSMYVKSGAKSMVFQSSKVIKGDGTLPDSAMFERTAISGLSASRWVNGMEDKRSLAINSESRQSTVTTTRADGTKVTENYPDRSLLSANDNSSGQTDTVGHDGLLRTTSVTGTFGTRGYELRANGTTSKTTLTDGRTIQVTAFNPATYQATQIKRADNELINRSFLKTGQLNTVLGRGVTPTDLDYDSETGQLVGLTTAKGDEAIDGTGQLTGTGLARTAWGYYDATGLLKSKTYAGQTEPAITYDYNDKLQLWHVYQAGSTATYSYDAAGRVSGISYGDGSGYSIGQFDAKGRLKSETVTASTAQGGGSLTTDYKYTDADQLDTVSQPQLGAGYVVDYGYYPLTMSGPEAAVGVPLGLESVKLMSGASNLASAIYKYDPISKRLKTVSIGNQVFTYKYKAGTDLIESIHDGLGGTTTTYAYESDTGRLQSMTTTSSTGLAIYGITYLYNANDQRYHAEVVQSLADGTSRTTTWDYSYDGYDQIDTVLQQHWDEQDTLIDQHGYDYDFDAVGNRTSGGFEANELNQYTTILGISSVTYDGRGNLTFDGTFHYEYSAQDQLTRAYSNTVKVESGYDAHGRRSWKKSFAWDAAAGGGAGDWVLNQHLAFAYDGWTLIGEFTVADDLAQTKTLLRSYAWGLDLGGGIGGLLSIIDYSTANARMYFPQYDGNGNVTGLTDIMGHVAATYEYDPFGTPLSQTGAAAEVNPFRFSTSYTDSETGLAYRGYRYYSPKLGRWINRDPIAEEGGENLYAYCGNDPVNRVDPVGLEVRPQHFSFDKETDTGRLPIRIYEANTPYYTSPDAPYSWITMVIDDRKYFRIDHVDIAIQGIGMPFRDVHDDLVEIGVAEALALAQTNPGRLRIDGTVDLAIAFQTGDTYYDDERKRVADKAFLAAFREAADHSSDTMYAVLATVGFEEFSAIRQIRSIMGEVGGGMGEYQVFGPGAKGGGGRVGAPQNSYLQGKTPVFGTRGTGVARASRLEVELVQKAGKGTIDWTAEEIEYIQRTDQLPDGIVGHHVNNVAQYPEWAGDPRNIQFVRGQPGNLDVHGGSFQNPTTGPLIDREAMIQHALGGKR